jgi:hypothetical protein
MARHGRAWQGAGNIRQEEIMSNENADYVVFEGSQIEASFPATPEGWQMALAYRDDTIARYTAEELAAVGVEED